MTAAVLAVATMAATKTATARPKPEKGMASCLTVCTTGSCPIFVRAAAGMRVLSLSFHRLHPIGIVVVVVVILCCHHRRGWSTSASCSCQTSSMLVCTNSSPANCRCSSSAKPTAAGCTWASLALYLLVRTLDGKFGGITTPAMAMYTR